MFHYVACMGYDDTPGAKALWIADSGFRPFGYWISFEQAATLIPDKAYAYANAAVPAQPVPEQPQGDPVAQPLTNDEQQELLTKVRYIYDQVGPGFDEWGEDGDLGVNAQGQRRTLRAGLATLLRKAAARTPKKAAT